MAAQATLTELRQRRFHIRELVEHTGVSARTIHRYLATQVLPPVKTRGRATTYGWEHLARLLYARLLREARHDPVLIPKDIKRTPLARIEAALVEDGLVATDRRPEPPLRTAATSPAEARPTLGGAERWTRVPVMPGLDLLLLDDASEIVHRVAAEVQARYRVP